MFVHILHDTRHTSSVTSQQEQLQNLQKGHKKSWIVEWGYACSITPLQPSDLIYRIFCRYDEHNPESLTLNSLKIYHDIKNLKLNMKQIKKDKHSCILFYAIIKDCKETINSNVDCYNQRPKLIKPYSITKIMVVFPQTHYNRVFLLLTPVIRKLFSISLPKHFLALFGVTIRCRSLLWNASLLPFGGFAAERLTDSHHMTHFLFKGF